MGPFSKQVGGSHYRDYAIQPYEFFYRNNIPHHKAAIIRRILRYDHKTGHGIEDLEKIAHEVELIKSLFVPNPHIEKSKKDGPSWDGVPVDEPKPKPVQHKPGWMERNNG